MLATISPQGYVFIAAAIWLLGIPALFLGWALWATRDSERTLELQREFAGFALALAFVVSAVYLIHLVFSALAFLGIDWYWWLGLALFIFTVTVVGRKQTEEIEEPDPVETFIAAEIEAFQAELDAAHDLVKAIGGSNHVPAEDRWGRAA